MKRVPVYLSQDELELIIRGLKEAYYSDWDKIREKLEYELSLFEPHPEPSNADEDKERRGFDNE